MEKGWTVYLDYDNETGDVILPISDEMMKAAGWNLGDTVVWSKNDDGSWTLSKKEETEWVLVETVQMFRHRYMVEVPKGKSEWALDTVVMQEAKEFSQEHLGETIVSHRTVNFDEAIALCDQDNNYLTTWTTEQKVNAFFTRDGEKVTL